jgi:hypothetical protein
MKWSVEHVKITLREADSGQTVVVEQDPGHASPKVKANGKEPDAEPARPKGDGESKAAKEPAKEPAPRAKKAAKRSSAAKVAAAPKARKATTLKWKPVRDHDYEGIGAKSGDGMFKILHAKNTQYALFYDVMGVDSAALGCFRKLENAKARAQEHHDKGFALPKKTAEQIRNVCPVGAPAEDDEDKETAEAAAESGEAANEAAGDADYMQALESVLEKQLNGH